VLEPNEWESVLTGARGTIYRGTERISSNRLLDLLGRGWQNEGLSDAEATVMPSGGGGSGEG